MEATGQEKLRASTDADVLVVGGGIIGHFVAAELAQAGKNVALLSGSAERASDGSLVWLNVSSTEDLTYAKLRSASMRLWVDAIAADKTCPVRKKGALIWDRERDALEDLRGVQNEVQWQAQVIDNGQFSELAPGIRHAPEAALFAPDECAADPSEIMNWAEGRSANLGVDVVREECSRAVETNGKVQGIQTASGEFIESGMVVLACGVGTPRLIGGFGAALPLKDAPGMYLRTEPMLKISDAVLASPLMDFWQGQDGRVHIATGTDEEMAGDASSALEAALSDLVALTNAECKPKVEFHNTRMRPVPLDGRPVVSEVPAVSGLYVAVMHSGMTLAPIAARGIAAMITGEEPPAELLPYRLERFAQST